MSNMQGMSDNMDSLLVSLEGHIRGRLVPRARLSEQAYFCQMVILRYLSNVVYISDNVMWTVRAVSISVGI